MATKIMIPVLDDRLLTVASFVRENSVVLDVGTDHGYIPIYLLKNSVCTLAIASDIKRKPLTHACENAQRFGVFDRMIFCLADGINDVNPANYNVTDIIVAGMGGEQIASIIDRSEYTRKQGVNLILQPMSSSRELRGYLAEMGYNVVEERVCFASGKYYTCMLARYDGVRREVPDKYIELGYIARNDSNKNITGYLATMAAKINVQIAGKRLGGLDTSHEEELLKEIREMANIRGLKL